MLEDLTAAQVAARFAFDDLVENGHRPALRLNIGPAASHRDLTFADLHRRASSIASALGTRGCQPGDRVALLLPQSDGLLGAFFGAVYAGFVPSIVAWPTTKMDPEKYQRNLAAVVSSLGAQWLVTEGSMASRLAGALGRTRVLDVGITDGAETSSEPARRSSRRIGRASTRSSRPPTCTSSVSSASRARRASRPRSRR